MQDWDSWFGTFVPLSAGKSKEKKYSEVQDLVNRNNTSCYLNSCIVFTFSLLPTSPHDLWAQGRETRETD